MRRVSIGMIEAVLLIKYRNTQPDSTAVLRKEYRSTSYGVLADASAIYPSRYYQGRDECYGASSHPSWGSA